LTIFDFGKGKVGTGALWAACALLTLAACGCGHRKQTQPPPQAQAPAEQAGNSAYPPASHNPQSGKIPVTPVPVGGVNDDDLDYIATHRPILTEVGLATWYRSPYKGRKAANGQVLDDHALTAAHRTLPMGSLVKVTNLKTGQASAMRITDRGPFVDGRIMDLTVASAKATGIYLPGTERVRMDVYRTPKPIEIGGRWCVQIGALSKEKEAIHLKAQLLHKYPGATVIEFPGEKNFWVRIRPEGDNREQAESIARHLSLKEGDAFLTRLD
jgi:rare lipoprotein A